MLPPWMKMKSVTDSESSYTCPDFNTRINPSLQGLSIVGPALLVFSIISIASIEFEYINCYYREDCEQYDG